MEKPFDIHERVVCISDRCPCCGEKLNAETRPDVGEVYTVAKVVMYGDSQNEPMLAFVPLISLTTIWPQCNFKRIPPQITTKDKKVSKPVNA